jgi:hypothetical protein
MGAYKYLEEIWRKKQSDVVRFLLRVRCVLWSPGSLDSADAAISWTSLIDAFNSLR